MATRATIHQLLHLYFPAAKQVLKNGPAHIQNANSLFGPRRVFLLGFCFGLLCRYAKFGCAAMCEKMEMKKVDD